MLFSFVDYWYHLIVYYTSKKDMVYCADNSCSAINLTALVGMAENKITTFHQDAKINT